jgi:hypothetical protein
MLGLDVISFSISMSLLFLCLLIFNKKKIGREDAELYFFLLIAFQILHVFCLISQFVVHRLNMLIYD